jgi:hypothetical protein
MQSDASHVLAWRQRLASLGVTQPFKQAHREIYVLTDAERQTHGYSNRFAGHVVQQKQFRALCQARGWSCPGLRQLGSRAIAADEALARDPGRVLGRADRGGDRRAGLPVPYLSTDQVRFANGDGEPIALEQVPPVLFSELMRDADLFVGVASIGNDPTWGDRGDGAYGDYWNRAAFGALRKPPRRGAPCCRTSCLASRSPGNAGLDDRFLVVEGKLRTYRIHLGSANVQMEPNSQYLCIVRGGRAAAMSVCRSTATRCSRSSSRRHSCWSRTTRSRTSRSSRRSASLTEPVT